MSRLSNANDIQQRLLRKFFAAAILNYESTVMKEGGCSQ